MISPEREKAQLSRFFAPRHHSQERLAYRQGDCISFPPSLEFDSLSSEFVSSSKSYEDENNVACGRNVKVIILVLPSSTIAMHQ